MRIDRLEIDNFKNLKNFKIDIDESQLTSVFIGKNGAGKSNLLEAMVIIFRDLDLNTPTIDFTYKIQYKCSGHTIQVTNNNTNNKRVFVIDGSEVSRAAFYQRKHRHPENRCWRMHQNFWNVSFSHASPQSHDY